MKKRILSVVLCTAMLATLLVGCGGKTEEPAEAPAAPAEEEAEAPAETPEEPAADAETGAKDKYVIGMSQCNLGEPWRVAMNDQIAAAAEAHPEFEIIYADEIGRAHV